LLTVHANPEDARILVNGRQAHSDEEIKVFPGELTVSVSAGGHRTAVREAELASGEKAELDIALNPLSMEMLDIAVPGAESASIYMGALYVGTFPDFSGLEIPQGSYAYINTETDDGRTGRGIVLGSENEGRIITFNPQAPLQGKEAEKRSVEVLRRKFYGAYGRFWVALPLAFLINGVFQSYAISYNASGSREIYDTAITAQNITMGAWIGAGLFLAETLVRLVFYVRAADKEAVPLFE
jgi:hypothetical protein